MINDAPSPAETYEHYLGPALADPFTRLLLEIVSPQRGECVLDLACGTGSVARHVAPMLGADGTVLALDINPDMLAVGRAQAAPTGARIKWREGSAERLELQDESFDLVLCQQGLQFFPDPPASLREIRRVLAPTGRVGVSVWQSLEQSPLNKAIFEATARHLGVTVADVGSAFSLGDADELRALLSDAGFQHVEVHPRSLEVSLPSPERFVQLMVMGAATSVPLFAQLDALARDEMIEAVTNDTQKTVQHYRDGDKLRFRMFTHIAVAHG